MTLLERRDGDDAPAGASYLELADLLMRTGARTTADLEQLWRRIVFFACVSNTDDHLRNHGFLLTPKGWILAPAYDMNPDPQGDGLKLNISESDNTQSLELILEVAPFYRIERHDATGIVREVVASVRDWRKVADTLGISADAQARMSRAFRLAEAS